jgi:alpha-glucan,water dikinase
MSDFKDGVVGAKSKNLANLRGKLPDWIKLPPAVTVPFSSFEKVGGGVGVLRRGAQE